MHSETAFDPRKLLFSASIDVEKHFSQKNAKKIAYRFGRGRAFTNTGKRFTPFIKSTPESMAQSEFFLLCLRSFSGRFNTSFPINNPVRVVWRFQLEDFYTKKGKVRLKKWDLDNLIAGPMDCLVKAGIIEDDGLIIKLEAEKVFGPNNVSVRIFSE